MSGTKDIDVSDDESSDESDVVNSVTSPSLRASAPAFVPSILGQDEAPNAARAGSKNGKGHADVTQLTKSLLQQIHWYFSDQNLAGDKFLREEIAKHPEGYVDVTVLADFPRIKAMAGDDTSLLICALKQSDKLQLSQDNTMIRPLCALPPYNPRKDAKRTIFVDRLPKDATVQSIKEQFSRFGAVLHVVPPGAEAHHLLDSKVKIDEKLVAEKDKASEKEKEAQKEKDRERERERHKEYPLRSVFIEFEKQGSAKKAVAHITAYNKQVKLKRKKGSKSGNEQDTPSLAPQQSPEMSPQFSPPSGSPLSPLSLPPSSMSLGQSTVSLEEHPFGSPESSPQLSPSNESALSPAALAELNALSIRDGESMKDGTANGDGAAPGASADEEKKKRTEKLIDLGDSFIGLYVMSRYAYDQKFGLPQSSPALAPQSPALGPQRRDSKADKVKKPEKLMTRDAMNWRKELTPDQIAEQASKLAASSRSGKRNGTDSPLASPSMFGQTPPRDIPAFMLSSPQTPPLRPIGEHGASVSKAVNISSRTPTQGKRTIASQDVRSSPQQSSRRILSASLGAEPPRAGSPMQSSRALISHDRKTASPIPSKRVLGFSVPTGSPAPATDKPAAAAADVGSPDSSPKKKKRSRNKKGGSKDVTPQSSPSMQPLRPTDTSFLKRGILSPGMPKMQVAQVKYARGPDDSKGFNRGAPPAASPAFRPRAASDALRGSGRRGFGSPLATAHGPSAALMHDLAASKFSLDGPASPPKAA